MTRNAARRIAGFYVFLVVFSVAPAAQQPDVAGETTRLIEKLKVGPASTVADVGAGAGDVTAELSKQLGPKARIYSTDVNEKTLGALEALVATRKLDNVTVQAGELEATALPEASCDAIFVRNVYHHFGNPEAMNASLLRTLKPGGRFAVIDFPPRNGATGPVEPAERASGPSHGVASDAVVQELEAAGFRIVEVIPRWTGGAFMVLAERAR